MIKRILFRRRKKGIQTQSLLPEVDLPAATISANFDAHRMVEQMVYVQIDMQSSMYRYPLNGEWSPGYRCTILDLCRALRSRQLFVTQPPRTACVTYLRLRRHVKTGKLSFGMSYPSFIHILLRQLHPSGAAQSGQYHLLILCCKCRIVFYLVAPS